MRNWRTETALYQVTEISKKTQVRYPIIATGDEIKGFLKTKREAYGYIAGLGGDKSYDCFAVLMKAE